MKDCVADSARLPPKMPLGYSDQVAHRHAELAAQPWSLKHPRFHAHLVTCDRCAFRRAVERSTRPRLLRAGVGQGGASACVRCTRLTHAEVMFSRSVRVRIGPARNGEPSRTHSVLYRPIVVSQSALSSASPTVPTDGLSPPASVSHRNVLRCTVQVQPVDATPRRWRCFRWVDHRDGQRR